MPRSTIYNLARLTLTHSGSNLQLFLYPPNQKGGASGSPALRPSLLHDWGLLNHLMTIIWLWGRLPLRKSASLLGDINGSIDYMQSEPDP